MEECNLSITHTDSIVLNSIVLNSAKPTGCASIFNDVFQAEGSTASKQAKSLRGDSYMETYIPTANAAGTGIPAAVIPGANKTVWVEDSLSLVPHLAADSA